MQNDPRGIAWSHPGRPGARAAADWRGKSEAKMMWKRRMEIFICKTLKMEEKY